MKLYSWNVNGIRAGEKKGFVDWLQETKPDILGIQETKARPEQLSDNLLNPEGYHTYWASAEKKGYSGVGLYSRSEPKDVQIGLGIAEFDAEGSGPIINILLKKNNLLQYLLEKNTWYAYLIKLTLQK